MIYIIAETVTLLFEIEAENEAEAMEKYKDTSIRDFDQVDCSSTSPHVDAKIVDSYEG